MVAVFVMLISICRASVEVPAAVFLMVVVVMRPLDVIPLQTSLAQFSRPLIMLPASLLGTCHPKYRENVPKLGREQACTSYSLGSRSISAVGVSCPMEWPAMHPSCSLFYYLACGGAEAPLPEVDKENGALSTYLSVEVVAHRS